MTEGTAGESADSQWREGPAGGDAGGRARCGVQGGKGWSGGRARGEVGDTEPVEAEFWTDNCQTMKGTGGILKQRPWVRVTPAPRR